MGYINAIDGRWTELGTVGWSLHEFMAANSVVVPYGVEDIATYTVTTPNASNRTTIMLPPKRPWQISNGHRSHRGGSGTHGDRHLKRLRTRADQRRAAVEE